MAEVEFDLYRKGEGVSVEIVVSSIGSDGRSEELWAWVPWDEWLAAVKRLEEAWRAVV